MLAVQRWKQDVQRVADNDRELVELEWGRGLQDAVANNLPDDEALRELSAALTHNTHLRRLSLGGNCAVTDCEVLFNACAGLRVHTAEYKC